MAIDDIPKQESVSAEPAGQSSHSIQLLVIALVLAALAVGEFYTVDKLSSTRQALVAQQNQMRSELTTQFQQDVSTRLTALEEQDARQLDAVKTELDQAAKHLGSQGGDLKRARAMVSELQDQQRKQAEELATKADQQQLGALTQDVSATKVDLDTTKKSVTTLSGDLGMARSELGTLIARNHDDVEYLRKLGERDYVEFTLERNHPTTVAGVGLDLKKTNVKRYRFNVALTVDDMQVEKKDRSVNEPIIFYVNGSKKPYELVVNSVGSNQVKGYVSTPKGVTQVATRSEGTH